MSGEGTAPAEKESNPMNILVFDTETTSLNKPFCYNLGYVIYDTDRDMIVLKRDFVVEQVWHNRPLFESAYYADKRPQYVQGMRAHKIIMDKYGYIQRQMARDIRENNVEGAYAFNSPFDDRVFEFNAEYYHCNNALDNVPVFDIRGYAVNYLMDDKYRDYCDRNADVTNGSDRKFVTESDGYKTTAESFYCFLHDDIEFNEAHTALSDSEIELEVLKACIEKGAMWNDNLPTAKSYPRGTIKPFKVKHKGEIVLEGECSKVATRKTKNGISITIE